jgi:hypothetical protein
MFKSKFLAIAALSTCAAAIGCGAGSSSSSSTTLDDSSATEALSAVQSCASQAHACDAGIATCAESYHSCLENLHPGSFGHGIGDGGLCDRDGSFGSFGSRDGGAAAVVTAVDACLQDLATCVKGGTGITVLETCATQAITCLTSSLDLPSPGPIGTPFPEDAGAPHPFPSFDASFPVFPSFDGGFPGWGTLPEFDGGHHHL